MSDQDQKTPEVETTRRTRAMFTWVMLLDVTVFLPRMIVGFFK